MRARPLQPRAVAPKRAASLPIRRRVLLRGDGTVLVQRIAHCARRMRTIGADVCAGCAEFTGTTRSAFGEAYISCRDPDAVAAEQRAVAIESSALGADSVPVHLCLARSFGCVDRGASPERTAEFLARLGAAGALLVDERLSPQGFVSVRGETEPLAGPVHENATLAHAAAVLAYEERDHMAIVDVDGAAVGLLGARDVLRWIAAGAGYLVPEEPAKS